MIEALLARRATLAVVRWLRRLLILMLILGGLAAAGNVWLANAAEDRAAEQIQQEFDLSAKPTVRIQGFPILLRVLQGRIPGVVIDGRGLEIQGLEISRFHVQVDGIATSFGDLLGGVRDIRVAGGEAFAEMTQDATNAYLVRQQERGTVTYGASTTSIRMRQRYGARTYTVVAAGTLEVAGEFLVFSAEDVTVDGGPPPPALESRMKRDASFRVRLPALPGGIRAKRVVVRPGIARLEAEFGATRLTFDAKS